MEIAYSSMRTETPPEPDARAISHGSQSAVSTGEGGEFGGEPGGDAWVVLSRSVTFVALFVALFVTLFVTLFGAFEAYANTTKFTRIILLIMGRMRVL
jgi:hypothetical protein